MLERTEIVRRSVVPGAISTPDQLGELVAVQPTFAGEQVTARRFATPAGTRYPRPADGDAAGDRRRRRPAAAARRHAQGGRHVDVVASFTHNDQRFTRIVLRDIPVLKPPASGAAQREAGRERRRRLRRDARRHRHAGAEAATGRCPTPRAGTSSCARSWTARTAWRTSRARVRCCARASGPKQLDDAGVEGKPMSDKIRIYVTGSCEGIERLREALATHPDLDFVGWSEHVAEATAALAGGHLQVVVHATRDTSLPARRAGGDPRADALADRRARLRRVVGAARRRARRRRRRRPAAAAADRERRLRAPQGRPCRPQARAGGRTGPSRPDRHRLLAEGRHRQDRHRDEPRRVASRSTRRSARSCSTSTSSSATPRSCSGSSRTRRSTTSSSHRASSTPRSSSAT